MSDTVTQICVDIVLQEVCVYFRRSVPISTRGRRHVIIPYADISIERRTKLQGIVTKALAKANNSPDWVPLRVIINPLMKDIAPYIIVEGWYEEPDGTHGPTQVREYRTKTLSAEEVLIQGQDPAVRIYDSLDFTVDDTSDMNEINDFLETQ